jgi:hypothetical protein
MWTSCATITPDGMASCGHMALYKEIWGPVYVSESPLSKEIQRRQRCYEVVSSQERHFFKKWIKTTWGNLETLSHPPIGGKKI